MKVLISTQSKLSDFISSSIEFFSKTGLPVSKSPKTSYETTSRENHDVSLLLLLRCSAFVRCLDFVQKMATFKKLLAISCLLIEKAAKWQYD